MLKSRALAWQSAPAEETRGVGAACPARNRDRGMGEIAGYERRITAALERIARSAEHLGPLVDAPAPVTAPAPEPQAPDPELLARIDALTRENQRLRSANAGLRESLAQIEGEIAQGAVDPGSIDRALRAELEALRADRAAEVAELDGILAELKPLIAGGLTHG